MNDQTNVYQENGYKSRREYFEYLADENDLTLQEVNTLSSVLGPEEDFDALVSACQDFSSMKNCQAVNHNRSRVFSHICQPDALDN